MSEPNNSETRCAECDGFPGGLHDCRGCQHPEEHHEFKPIKAPRVVITLEGGMVQTVFASDPGLELVVVDYDVDGVPSKDLTEIGPESDPVGALISIWEAQPLTELNEDVAQAIVSTIK